MFTIAAGAFNINFTVFILASLVSRSARFFLVGGLIYIFGPRIQAFIDNWRKSWEEKDITTFASFYSEKYYNFKNKENKEKFIKKKEYLAKRYKTISVKVEKPAFYYSPTYSVIQFKQIYKSSSYYSEGIKNLYLKKEKGKYKILTESFVKDNSVKYWPCKK